MPQLFDPRRLARTPGFAQDGLYDDLAAQDDYEQQQLPVQSGGGPSGMLQAAPDAPLPPPRREYDGGPSVDPGPQARQRITLEAAPLPPKPGLMRQIIGTAASMYLPPVGREILAPGYDRKMREYNANRQRMMDEGKLNVQAADEAGKLAHAAAEANRGEAQKSYRAKLDKEADYVGNKPIVFNRNQRVGDPKTKEILFEAEDTEEKAPPTIEAAAARALSIKDPVEREDMLKRIADAHNLLHPERPIQGVKVGSDGQIVAYTIDPKKVAGAGGSMTVGRVTPKPTKGPKSDATASAAEDIADAIINGKQDFHGLTPTEKKAVRPVLTAKGWTEPANYSESEKQTLTGLDGLKRLSSELAPFFQKGKSAAGTGMLTGHAPDWTVTEEGKRIRTAIADMASSVILARSGKAVTPHEMVRIEKFIPTQTDTDEQIRVKLENLDKALDTARASIDSRAKGGRVQGAATSTQPTAQSPQPAAGSVRMRHPNGSIRLVPQKDVAAAEAANYKRVQ